MNRNTLIIGLVIVGLMAGYFWNRRQNGSSTSNPTPTPIEQVLNLPESWKPANNDKVELELDKKVDNGYAPQVVLTKTTAAEAVKPAAYVDTLKKGARSAIPSLNYTEDKRNSLENLYTAFMAGTYFNKQKINLIQRVYIQGQDVYTLTASFTGDLASEVNPIMDSIANEKILK